MAYLRQVTKTYTYKLGVLIFMKWNFKINLEYKPLPLATGSNFILRKIYEPILRQLWLQKNKKILFDLCHTTHISRLENMEIKESFFY